MAHSQKKVIINLEYHSLVQRIREING